MNLHSLMIKLKAGLKLFKDFWFYLRYVHITELILTGQSRRLISLIYLLIFVLALKSVHMLSLRFVSFTDLQRTIQYDAVYFALSRQLAVNIVSACNCAMVCRVFYLLYFTDNRLNNHLLCDILVRHDWHFFLRSVYKGKPICQYIQDYYLRTFNLMIYFPILATIFLSVSHLILFVELIARIEQISNWLQSLLIYCLSGLCFDFFVMAYTYMIIFTISTGLIQQMVLTIKLRQLFALLKRRRYFWLIFDTFRRNLAQTLRYLAPFNRLYGRIFVTFLVVNGPINGYLLVLIVMGSLSSQSAIFLGLNTLLSAICLFVVHLYLVSFAHHFHRPAKLLLKRCLPERQGAFHLERPRSKLRLALSATALHTNAQYGITYGNFGLVTLQTFSKFLMLYFKIVMISYKLMRKPQ